MKPKLKPNKKKKTHINDSQPSDLPTAAVRIAVAQICNSVGYKGAQTSALETLTAVTVKYLQSVAKSAVTSANSTGRTECNLFDIIRGLEDLHANIGFVGNSDVNKNMFGCSVVKDTMKFVYSCREIPFAKPLPCLYVVKTPPTTPTWGVDESVGLTFNKHVPRWLPAFPRTEATTPVAEDVTESVESKREVSELPKRRKKVRFTVGGCGNNNVRQVFDKIERKAEVGLRVGVCKGGKRISCQMYDDGEKFVNASCSGNIIIHGDAKDKVSMKIKK